MENPTRHQVVIGDSRRLRLVEDDSVHLVVTSPPYWQLKDYGDDNQIGFDDSYEDYVNHLNLVWNECRRVLAPAADCARTSATSSRARSITDATR